MAVSPLSTSALSSLEAMLNSLMERSEEGDETPRHGTLDSPPPPPPLPARPAPRGRRPSLPKVVGAAGPWTPPSSPSPHKEDSVLMELERKAMKAEAQLRQKEEENIALRRQIESYHVRWLEYEIKIKSLEETFHEQMASLQTVQDTAGRADEMLPYDGHESSESHMKMSEETAARLRHGCHGVGVRRSAVGRLGAEFQRQSQALENHAAALVEPRPWQPGVPSANTIDDLKKLKSQFRAWKKDYKARLRKTKAELDRDRRRRSSCWI